MKRFLIAALSGLGVIGAAVSASAADLPARFPTKAPAYVAPFYNWTGFYLGGNVGYGFGNSNDVTLGNVAGFGPTFAAGAVPGSIGLDPDGIIGGGQIGYNWQFNSIVFGFEADIMGADIRDSRSVATTGIPGFVPATTSVNSRLDYLGTVRGRVGYAFDRVLFYGTGGFAYGGLRQNASIIAAGGAPAFTGSSDNTETGYAVGGGIEYAIFGNWTVRGEYLYYDLGRTTVNISPASAGAVGTAFARFDNTGQIARAALNYRF